MTHSQVWLRNSDQPSRSSRSIEASHARSCARTLIESMSGTVPSRPVPQMASAQPGPLRPIAAMNSPASTAPPIWAPFIASLEMALASCSRAGGTIRGTSACDAG